MANFYPPLDLATLRNLEVVRALAKEQPKYFEDSPYSPEIEQLIRAVPAPHGPSKQADTDDLDLLAELTSTLKDLKDYKPSKEDSTQAMGYFRTKTSLIDKLMELMDRGKNQKSISEFYAAVLLILEEVCTPTQVAQFSDKLKEFAAK
jgi:hypothetical protein